MENENKDITEETKKENKEEIKEATKEETKETTKEAIKEETKPEVKEGAKEIEETDFSVLEPTKDNRITLITCIANQRAKRLCVIGIGE